MHSSTRSRTNEPIRRLAWGNRALDFRTRPYVMGILNCTPDSFYPGSRVTEIDQAVQKAQVMIQAGADILDVGGESTRPGSDPVEAEQEIHLLTPEFFHRSAGDEKIYYLSRDTDQIKVQDLIFISQQSPETLELALGDHETGAFLTWLKKQQKETLGEATIRDILNRNFSLRSETLPNPQS